MMVLPQYEHMRQGVTDAFSRLVPHSCNDAWLRRMVDQPRFGWDCDALEQGFFRPLHAFALQHTIRLRPLLAALLIEAFQHDPTEHIDSFAILELLYVASIMMDHVRNGRNLAASTLEQQTIPLPVWVTIAYNARQLAPVMIYRQADSLAAEQRSWLALRMGEFLIRQGIGSAFDLWGDEQALQMRTLDQFLEYVRLYVGPLSFRLTCDVASAVVGLEPAAADQLARAGCELGVAMRLAALAEGEDASVQTIFGVSVEQTIHWKGTFAQEELKMAADRIHLRALKLAGDVHPAALAAFERFGLQIVSPRMAVA